MQVPNSINFLGSQEVVEGSDSNLIHLGLTVHDLIAPFDDEPQQIYLMKTDAQGNRLWDHTYGNMAHNEQPQDLVQLPDGGYLIVGYTYFNQAMPPYYNIATFLLRTDAQGNELNINYLPGTNLDLTCIVAAYDGNYVLAGTHCNTDIDSCGVAVVKVDADGNILWQRTHWTQDAGTGIAIIDDIAELADGTFIGCGRLTPDPNDLNALGLVMKTDPAGFQLWNRTLDKTSSYDSFTRITSCSDGGILLTGQMQRDQLSDVWLEKLDSNGCDSAGCPEDIHTALPPVDTSSAVETHAVLTAMPNPFSGITVLRYAVPVGCGQVTLVVRDALGRSVRTEGMPGSTGIHTFESGELPAGVYLATLLFGGEPRATVRLLIER